MVPGGATALPIQGRGLLRLVTPSALNSADQAAAQQRIDSEPAQDMKELARHIRGRLSEFRAHRTATKIDERLLSALRTFKGEYDQSKLQEIKKFGGSDVYARLVAMKCRGFSSLIREVYLSADRPWELAPTPEPTIPDDIESSVKQLVQVEAGTLQMTGQAIDPQMMQDRYEQLIEAAEHAAKKQADEEAKEATTKLDDLLVEGGFYTALAEFLIDLPIFPFAVLKGPVVKRVPRVKWVNGKAQVTPVPKMFWYRVSPFDLFFSPSATRFEDAEIIERIQLTRAELQQLRGLPGYDTQAIETVLENFSDKGIREWWSSVDTERKLMEDRERWPRSDGTIDSIEYHGSVSGKTLLDWGMDQSKVPDPLGEYFITAWLIDRWVIKVQINPSPRQRHPYYSTSFEKVPGTPVGNGLPDILDDMQNCANAALRSLINNLSIASGPQVAINDELLAPGETDDSLYPWKRWHFKYDPMTSSSGNAPITFFQPTSNAAELLGVYEKFSQMADEISAIPRYMMGNERVGGAGRTASGLAMMMSNASKVLQNVAANVDREVMQPCMENLYDIVMLTAPDALRGDEAVVVKGVNFAVKREQDRMRQLEFLQLTGNPIDMQIVGMKGRANVLRSVADNLGLDHEDVVPSDKELMAMQQQQQMLALQQPQQGASQQPGPDDKARAPAEDVRRPVEGEMSNNATGRPGMRAGG